MRPTVTLRSRFEQWTDRFGRTWEQLAEYVDVTVEELTGLADTPVPTAGGSSGPGRKIDEPYSDNGREPEMVYVEQLSQMCNANFDRLSNVVMVEPPDDWVGE